MKEWKPFGGTGKVVRDYKPLKLYLELTKGTEWYDKAFLNEEDFQLLRKEAKETPRLLDLMEKLKDHFKKRINPEKALEAFKAAGYPVEREEAVDMLSEILAGWLVEAGEEWDLIRFRGPRSES